MAEMTLEKAKAILSTTRKSRLQRLDTDLRIARHRHKSAEGFHGGMLILLCLNIGMFLTEPETISWVEIGVMILFSILSIVSYLYKERYSKIRMLFEDAAPQNIDEILSRKESIRSASS
jgi:Flp pilus assembly protein TadB